MDGPFVLPFQGESLISPLSSQGVALGWFVQPLRGDQWILTCVSKEFQGVALGWFVQPLRGEHWILTCVSKEPPFLVLLVPKLLFGNEYLRNSVSRLRSLASPNRVSKAKCSQTGVWE